MKKKLSVGLIILICSTGILTNHNNVKASTTTLREKVIDKIDNLNEQYELNISMKENSNEKQALGELKDLEEQLIMIQDIKQFYNNTINVKIDADNHDIISINALDVHNHEWSTKQIVEAELGTLTYIKSINFNYTRKAENGYYKFVEIFNVSSDVTSIDDLLIGAGLKGWKQDSYNINYTNNSRKATITIKGHYNLGLNYDFINIGVKQPFSEETWVVNFTFQ